jgi:hypothetical protein
MTIPLTTLSNISAADTAVPASRCVVCAQAHALRAAAAMVSACGLNCLHLNVYQDRITVQVRPEEQARTSTRLTELVGLIAAHLDAPATVQSSPDQRQPSQMWIEAAGTLAGHPASIFALTSVGVSEHSDHH